MGNDGVKISFLPKLAFTQNIYVLRDPGITDSTQVLLFSFTELWVGGYFSASQ